MKLSTVSTLTIAVMLLVGLDYLNAAWTDPTSAPTGANVAAPVNVGSVDQAKTGGLSTGNLNVTGSVTELDTTVFDYWFTNTAASERTMWRLRRNDGTGNFLTYINTEGGSGATFFTDGFAFRERFLPELGTGGEYQFFTSNGGPAGTAITWTKALGIGNGAINVSRICDANGANCQTVNNLGGGGGGGGSILGSWPNTLNCNGHVWYIYGSGAYKYSGGAQTTTRTADLRFTSYGDYSHWNSAGMWGGIANGCAGWKITDICDQGRCGPYSGTLPAVPPGQTCNAYGCVAIGGTCNAFGCSETGVCTAYGCP